jgi:2-dehydro-3-deoxyphosphogluconate aldolase/(4S)-4-hydroxy-2-oxoglutarate aldolase
MKQQIVLRNEVYTRSATWSSPGGGRAISFDAIAHRLARCPVLVVLRGHRADNAVRLAEACWSQGVDLVEVSLSHDRQLEAVRAVCARASGLGRLAGAGTVCTPGEVRAAAEAGAAFAVAPGLDAGAVQQARELGLPYLPAVATPTETQAAIALGCRTLKFFPAGMLGPGWLRALAGPFPQVDFVAVGGIDAGSAAAFMEAGALGIGIGSALEVGELSALVERLRNLRQADRAHA